MRTVFISGIGTEVGKTVASAVVVEALGADYWKPIQAGNLEQTDTDRVRALVSNLGSCFHPEQFRLSMPLSPHAAARRERIEMRIEDFILPPVQRLLVIEGAGGLMVPINERNLMLDLIGHFGAPVLLVSRHYLGSINHTLLSIAALEQRGIPLIGLLFNGQANAETESVIAAHSRAPVLGRIDETDRIDRAFISRYAAALRAALAGAIERGSPRR